MEVWVLGDVCRWWCCAASAVRRRGPRFTRPQVLGVDDPIVNISSWGACETGWEGQAHGVRQGPCWGVFGVMTGLFRGVPPCPLLEARRGPTKPDVRGGGEPLPRVPCDVGAGGAVQHVVQALAGETIAGELGGGGQVVGSFVSEDVRPPLFGVWAERHSDPLGVDFRVPERKESWGGNAVPGKTANVSDTECEHGGACHREEGACPRPVVAAFTKSLEVFARCPYAGSGHVRTALVDGADLQPHTGCDHLRDELQLGQHLEPRDGVPRQRAAPSPVPEKQEAAVDSQLDVVVAVGALQGASYRTEVRGPGAFGESPDCKCQCVTVVVAQPCTQRCSVGIPCLGHCDGDLGWRGGLRGG